MVQKTGQLRNARHRIDDSEAISEGMAFFLGRQLVESPSFFNASQALKKKEEKNTEGVTVSIQTLTLQEDEIGYGVSYESNRYVNVRVSYFPVLGLYALL